MASQQIENFLLACGYQSESPSSSFESLTGGLLWCIANSNADVSYKVPRSGDQFGLGAKIQIAESIESALRCMKCPFPLQAHQIQGLDHAAVLPVVEWLAKRVIANREQEIESGTLEKQAKEKTLSPQKLESSDHAHKPVHDESYNEQITGLQTQIEHYKETLSLLKQNRAEFSSSEKRAAIDEEVKKQKYLQSRITEVKKLDHQTKLDELVSKLKELKVLDEDKGAIFQSFKRKHEFQNKPKVSASREEPDMNSIRSELAKVSRTVVALQRRLDDLPVQSELMQYERYFMELYINIQAKLRETRKYFASYNALVEVNELSTKEVSLLNSIHSQYEMAMATPEARAKFVESLQTISTGVQQRLKKMEQRLAEKKISFDVVKEKHGAALATRRQYFALLKQLQEELARLV